MSQTKQLPLVQRLTPYIQRGAEAIASTSSSGPNLLNGFLEENKDAIDNSRKIAFCKRPGALDFEYATTAAGFTKTNLKTTNTGERIHGLCTSLNKSQVLFITQDATKRYSNIYTVSTNTLTQTDITASFSTGEYAMTVLDGLMYGTNVYYAATNGTDGALIDSAGVWSKITDADYTGNGTKTNFVGLDGYLFYGVISGTNAGRIYNSDLSAAAAASGWTALGFLTASDVPGSLVWLGRVRNYLVAFKQYSIEFFENVGNPTPGSPLEPRKQLTKRIGLASAASVQEVGDGLIFLGVDSNGKFGMYKILTDSLEVKKISDGGVDLVLQNPSYNIGGFQSFSNDALIGATVRGQSQVIIIHNKELYTITVYSAWQSVPITLVYDVGLDIWMQWATAFEDGSSLDNTFKPSMCFLLNNTTGGYWTCFANNFSTNTKSRFSIFLATDSTSVPNWFKDQYELATTNAHTFEFAWVSDLYDFGTHDRKFLHSLEVIYDSLSNYAWGAAGSNTSTLTMYVFREDHARLSNAFAKTIDDGATKRAKYWGLGSGHRVGFIVSNSANMPLRMWAVQVTYSDGIAHA